MVGLPLARSGHWGVKWDLPKPPKFRDGLFLGPGSLSIHLFSFEREERIQKKGGEGEKENKVLVCVCVCDRRGRFIFL